ncbi:hypothetical protein GQ53DRAFT_757021 [Thozetella sp. PMI_491]|nr:hypothetical protein GQ53DRAFT_757021 [Thozetella sp. PMI_491]
MFTCAVYDWQLGSKAFVAVGIAKDQKRALKGQRDVIWALSDNTYSTSINLFHQLHCLNSIRKLIYTISYSNNRLQARSWQPQTPLTIDLIHLQYCIALQPRQFIAAQNAENVMNNDKWVCVMEKSEDAEQRSAPDAYYIYKTSDVEKPNHINGAIPKDDFNI